MDRVSGSASTTLLLCMEYLRHVSNGSIIQTDTLGMEYLFCNCTALFSMDMMFKYMS